MVKTITLERIDPYIFKHPSFQELKDEKEAELKKYHQEGCEVRIEVQYPKRLPQIYQCVFPKNGDINWKNCEFLDVTEPDVHEHI